MLHRLVMPARRCLAWGLCLTALATLTHLAIATIDQIAIHPSGDDALAEAGTLVAAMLPPDGAPATVLVTSATAPLPAGHHD